LKRARGAWLSIGLLCALAASASADEIDRRIDAMSPDARLAQLLFVGFTGTEADDELRRLVGGWHAGGVAIYSSNITSATQLRALTRAVRHLAGKGVPPFVALDQEGGEVTRISDEVPMLPGNMALGATRSATLARRAGRAVASDLRRLGITMNFAPVVDLSTDAESSIGIRSFGSDPALAGSLAAAFIRGQSEAGVVSVAKHFPGIGSSRVDSHDELPVLRSSAEELRRDLQPFRAAIDAGVDAVMLGHALVPRIDARDTTRSAKTIALLRRDLRFNGVVITDVLEMGAVDKGRGVGRIALDAIDAGADMVMVLWHEHDRDEVFAALKEAYRSGALSEQRVRASLRRILRAKSHAASASAAAPDRSVGEDIAAASATLLRNRGDILPLRPDSSETTVYIGPGGPIAAAAHAAREVHPPVRFVGVELENWAAAAAREAAGATRIVAAAQNVSQMQVVRAAHEANPGARVVLVSLGSPQLIRELPDADAYLCLYGYLPVSQRAAARVLEGAAAPGRLPADVPVLFHAGDGSDKEAHNPPSS
jgi:beta-N-acetylhexosaminidase